MKSMMLSTVAAIAVLVSTAATAADKEECKAVRMSDLG
ncbi:MAG: hypothetical protein JWL86_6571 [Rhizobium sp.]|nr:hypothetical protein [Rhizobium sp.]